MQDLIGEIGSGKTEKACVKTEHSSDHTNGTGLSTARWPMEKVTTTVWKAMGFIPSLCILCDKIFDIPYNTLNLALWEDDTLRRTGPLVALIGPIATSHAIGLESKQGEPAGTGALVGLLPIGAPFQGDGAQLLENLGVVTSDNKRAIELNGVVLRDGEAVGPVM